jgi:MFS transporter, DHA2 family, metal-tetracycline-proton antiporter
MVQPGAAPFHNRLVPLICFIVFFSVLNGTMFNVAVPDIAEEFALSPGAVSWVITVYIVAFALAAVTYGKLADLYPVRNLITIGLVLFNIGALLGFLAGSYPLLIGARLIQASGGGAIPAMGMLVATRYFPPESRGRVLGAIASTVAFGSGVGPIVGGFLAGSFDWRYLFLVSTATLVAIPLFRRLLPHEKGSTGLFDWRGAVLLAGFVGMFLLFLTQGEPWALPPALVALAAFSLHIRRSPNPFVPAALFANLQYRSGLLTTFLAVGTVFCMFFLVPFHLRQIHQLDTWQIGLVLFPGAVSAAFLGNVGGRLADRIGSPAVVSTGLSLLVAGFLLLAAFANQGAYLIASILIVPYIGFSFIHASLAKTASLALHHSHTGIGMGFYNLIFFTAGAFGAALSGRLLELAAGMVSIDPYRLIFLGAAITDLLALGIFQGRFKAARRSEP